MEVSGNDTGSLHRWKTSRCRFTGVRVDHVLLPVSLLRRLRRRPSEGEAAATGLALLRRDAIPHRHLRRPHISLVTVLSHTFRVPVRQAVRLTSRGWGRTTSQVHEAISTTSRGSPLVPHLHLHEHRRCSSAAMSSRRSEWIGGRQPAS